MQRMVPEERADVYKRQANDGFPFEIKKKTVNPYRTLSESEFMDKLETSRMHAKQGDYRDADDVIAEMRNRYGL